MPAGMTSSSSVHSEGATVKERGALARLCRLLLPLRGACWLWAQGSIQPVPPRHQVSHRTKPCRADLLHCLAPEHARLCLLLERGTLPPVSYWFPWHAVAHGTASQAWASSEDCRDFLLPRTSRHSSRNFSPSHPAKGLAGLLGRYRAPLPCTPLLPRTLLHTARLSHPKPRP